MKAEELMKGNWMFSKRFQRPVRIVAVASRVLYYADGVLRTEKVENVSPIPLTRMAYLYKGLYDAMEKRLSECAFNRFIYF